MENYVTKIEQDYYEALSQRMQRPQTVSKESVKGPISSPLISDAVEKFIESKIKANKSKSTISQYQTILKNFVAFCETEAHIFYTTEISDENVEAFLRAHEACGVAKATIAADLRTLRVFAAWCKKKNFSTVI